MFLHTFDDHCVGIIPGAEINALITTQIMSYIGHYSMAGGEIPIFIHNFEHCSEIIPGGEINCTRNYLHYIFFKELSPGRG